MKLPKPAQAKFAFTIFLSAFLLFWVQLLLGKYILPWFGGGPAVWTSCMLFFQVLLLGGYTYPHVLCSCLNPGKQALLHCLVVLSSLLLLACLAFSWDSPITPGSAWKPHGADDPVWHIVTLLCISVGLPYFVLSSTGPLLQAWSAGFGVGGSPYRLYALSNFGSFLALLAYPALLEPQFTLKSQARFWSYLYVAFAIGCVICAIASGASRPRTWADLEKPQHAPAPEAADAKRPGSLSYLLWTSLSVCASIMFLATTNQICQDVGVVPLLWILPLATYLLSFVIGFEREHWYSRRWFHPAFGLALWAACFLLYDGAVRSLVTEIGIYACVLFVVCIVCNGELVRSKPQPRDLTSFYLSVAAGGAIGGIFVALVAPRLFKGFWEYQLGLWMSALLLLVILVRDKTSWLYRSRFASPVVIVAVAALLPETAALANLRVSPPASHFPVFCALLLIVYALTNRKQEGSGRARERIAPVYCAAALLFLAMALVGTGFTHVRNAVTLSRNFYGVLAVSPQDSDQPDRAAFRLTHGRIVHGFQFRAQTLRDTPTAYYGPTSGVGVAIRCGASVSQAARRGLRIGVVGLGVGTIAAYGKLGDVIRFYEINPEVIRIASDPRYFTFLNDSPAKIEVISGDARLSMERELERNEAQNFDVLAIDAFSGDAIPVHLLTLEAFQIYLKELREPSGILAIHITNTYLDLRPVIFAAAKHLGLKAAWIHSDGDGRTTSLSDWVLISQGGEIPTTDSTSEAVVGQRANIPAIRPWTDDYSSLRQILNPKHP